MRCHIETGRNSLDVHISTWMSLQNIVLSERNSEKSVMSTSAIYKIKLHAYKSRVHILQEHKRRKNKAHVKHIKIVACGGGKWGQSK